MVHKVGGLWSFLQGHWDFPPPLFPTTFINNSQCFDRFILYTISPQFTSEQMFVSGFWSPASYVATSWSRNQLAIIIIAGLSG